MSDELKGRRFSELDSMFRMPADFGPSPGPRNLPVTFRDVQTVGRVSVCRVQARTDRAALESILPPGLKPSAEPLIDFFHFKLSNLGWLAGRGYNIVAIMIPVTYERGGEQRPYDFMPVLWESLADPIITGREELGHPKLPASIPDPAFLRDGVRGAAHWEGFRFCQFEIQSLRKDDRPPGAPRTVITRRYQPRTGAWGLADVDQFTGILPNAAAGGTKPAEFHRRDRGVGSFSFIPARWEDMPTQYPVVCRLAELPLLEFVDATVTEVDGTPDTRAQGIYGDIASRP